MAALALLVAVPAAAERQAEFDFRAAIADPEVLALFATLIDPSHSRAGDLELAAFLVSNGDGVTRVKWPTTNLRGEQEYRGRIPRGTVAIFHSHPWLWPKPSQGDVVAARHTGLPIYALTRDFIYAVDPDSGEIVELVAGKNWSRDLRKSYQASSRTEVSPNSGRILVALWPTGQ